MLQCGLLRSNFSLAIAFCSSVEFVNPANSNLVLLLALLFLDHFLSKSRWQLRVMRKMHGERRAALRTAAQIRGVAEHLRQRNLDANHVAARAIFRALDRRAPRVQIAEH